MIAAGSMDHKAKAHITKEESAVATHWGVDSDQPVTSAFFNWVKSQAGAPPEFWGRYFGPTGNLTKYEASLLHDNLNCKILLIFNDITASTVANYSQGSHAANAAMAAANALGVANGPTLYADLEPSFAVTSAWLRGWADAFANSSLKYSASRARQTPM